MSTCQDTKRDKQASIDDVIVNGSTWAAIWHMSWPLLMQMSSVSVASFSDVWVAGKLGSGVQAAIGICGHIWFFMLLLTVALSAGTNALVSRFWGARDMEEAKTAAKQCMIFAFLFGTSSAILGYFVARPLLAMLGATPEVQELGWKFLQIDLISQLPFTVIWVAHAVWRAMGNARTPMMIWVVMTISIVTLNCVLCISPLQLGIQGIATAWVVAAFIGLTLNMILLRTTELGDCVRVSVLLKDGMSKSWLGRILRIGIPACVTDLAWVGGCFVLFLIFAQTKNPTACQAAWAVGFRLEEIVSCLPIYALSTAVATIVGQNLGAKKPERAERAGWQVAFVGGTFCTVMAAVLVLGADVIASMMSKDPAVIEYSAQYLRVVGLSQPFVAVWLVLFGAMQGAGYTKWPMWASIVALTGLRLPLAWYLTVKVFDGPIGCWIAVAAASVILGILAAWRYASGVWKTQEV